MTLRIILRQPPSGIDFGVQLGATAAKKIDQVQRSSGQDLVFECTVEPKGGDYRGAAVQGKKGDRFIYICVGQYAGQVDTEWARRIKVPLAGIPSSAEGALTAVIPGTGRDGGPSAATVRPVDGWRAG